ncbi:MAG: TonB-dependent receptor [Emcibacteraceae bacterium]|nr:TonB-dependent receptor [Emcibacteraceae bacterium]
MSKVRFLKTTTSLITISLMSSFGNYASAQDAGDDNVDVIYVTGSLIKRSTQENSSSPLNVVTTGDLAAQGLNNVGDIARNMTFNSGSELNTDAFTQNFSTGTSNVNLRNLGLGSTLVLLNGKRQTLSSAYADDGSTFVDTNSLMPLIMIDRVETLKDGGSAIYGTDAVSGVVNYITRKNFDGFEIEAGLQSTTSDSQRDYDISAIWGKELSNGANFVIAGSFMHRTVLTAADRSEITSGSGISGSGQPGTIVFRDQIPTADPTRDLNMNGFIDILPVIDPYCGTAEYSIPNELRAAIPTGPGTSVTPGTCSLQFDQFYDLVPEEDRVQVFTSFDSDVGDNMHFYIEAGYANNKASRNNAPSFPIASPVPVLVGDGMGGVLPNVPTEIQPLVQGLGLATVLFIGRAQGANGEPFVSNHDNETYRVAATLHGDISDLWTWETSATYSQNKYGINANDILRDNYIGALTTGAFNPFGTAFTTHPNSQEAIDAITAEMTLDGKTELFTYDAHVTGEVGEINGNPIQLAVGGQYRNSKMNYDWSDDYNGPNGDGSNSGALPTGLNGGNLMFLYGGPDYGGERDVVAGFAELAVPLHDTLDVQLAARYEDYGSGVNSFDPKVSALWRPIDELSVRGSFSTAFRAPSLYNVHGVQTALNEITLGTSSTFLPVTSNGNANLKPEEANVYNIGFTWSTPQNFRFGMDYWRYDFSNLITQENSQSVVNRALAGDLTALSQLEFSNIADPTSLFHINTNIINAPTVTTDGIDVMTSYDFDTSRGGTVHLGAEATYVIKYDAVDQAGTRFDGAGMRNFGNFARSMPEWRANFNVGYREDNHIANVFVRYIDSYIDDQNDVTVSSYTTVDMQYSYIFGDPDDAPLQATVGVMNLFNKQIPRLDTNAGFDTKVHDPRQRMIYMKLSKKF